MFQFPDETAFLQEWFKKRAVNQIVGFENNEEDGDGSGFNFILSNGTRSTQRDWKYPTKFAFMIPTDALNKIRRVTIHYDEYLIRGFSFFDNDDALLWEIGEIRLFYNKETVVLAENEVIVGVVAKLPEGWQSAYTDF